MADGLRQAAALCMSKAHYFAGELEKIGLPRLHTGEYFHEFVTKCGDPAKVLKALDENGILGGLPVEGGGCASPTAMSAPQAAGVSITARAMGLHPMMNLAPAAWAASHGRVQRLRLRWRHRRRRGPGHVPGPEAGPGLRLRLRSPTAMSAPQAAGVSITARAMGLHPMMNLAPAA